jgi:hypothetical protein
MVDENKMPRLLTWRGPPQGLGGSETPMNTKTMNRTNEVDMIQHLILVAETRVYGLRCRRRCRQLGGVQSLAPVIAQMCLSDLLSLDLTRGIRW